MRLTVESNNMIHEGCTKETVVMTTMIRMIVLTLHSKAKKKLSYFKDEMIKESKV
jgi:hypothetical protein